MTTNVRNVLVYKFDDTQQFHINTFHISTKMKTKSKHKPHICIEYILRVKKKI